MARNDDATFGTIVIHCFDWLVEREHIGIRQLFKQLLLMKINQECLVIQRIMYRILGTLVDENQPPSRCESEYVSAV